MENKNAFSQEELNELFKINPQKPDLVVSRESSTLEFKESFGWNSFSRYMKTSAAFANAKGGYIVFGIANKPHRLCGLSGDNLQAFQDLDPEKVTNNFNEYFSPEVEWEINQYELQGKFFGLLYIHEAQEKPVVCKKNEGKELKESDIYYRYRGRSERIKYPELRAILEVKRETEQRLWLQHLEKIARIGVREAGIFDLHTGIVTGTGGSFVIDESLLSQLLFIKEGEFSEAKGRPTLKLIGQVESLTGPVVGGLKKQIIKTKGIRTSDIILCALGQEKCPEPKEYIKQICVESSAFLPVYYYINKSGLTLAQILQILESVVSRSPSRKKLIERLKSGKNQSVPIPGTNKDASTIKRKFITELLENKNMNELKSEDLLYCIQAIRGLKTDEINCNSEYIRALLKTWFNLHYASADSTLADNMRRAICWVDEALYLPIDY